MAAAGVALGLALAGCTGSGTTGATGSATVTASPTTRPSASASPALALSRACPKPAAAQAKTTADQLNTAVGGTIKLPAWQAADIGASARLHDGRIVWLFGDTVRPGLQPAIVANSMLVSWGGCVAQLLDSTKGPVIPDARAGVVRWPMSVAVTRKDGRDSIIVLCSRIDRGDSGAFGFTFLGTSAAVFEVDAGGAPQLTKVVDITPDSEKATQVNWGAASTIRGDWLYVYGTRLTGKDLDFGRELYVARGAAADPGDRDQWRFWDGAAWQRDPAKAALVLPSKGGVSQTLSVQSIGNEFVAVSKRDGDVSDFVYKWTAPHPWGPWTAVRSSRPRPATTPATSSTPRWPTRRCRWPTVSCWSRSPATPPTSPASSRSPRSGARLFVAIPR